MAMFKGIDTDLLKKDIDKILKQFGSDVVFTSRNNMKQPKSGIKYRNLPYRSSKRGEGLASQSGKTLRSIGFNTFQSGVNIGSNEISMLVWEMKKDTLGAKYNNRNTINKFFNSQLSSLNNQFRRDLIFHAKTYS